MSAVILLCQNTLSAFPPWYQTGGDKWILRHQNLNISLIFINSAFLRGCPERLSLIWTAMRYGGAQRVAGSSWFVEHLGCFVFIMNVCFCPNFYMFSLPSPSTSGFKTLLPSHPSRSLPPRAAKPSVAGDIVTPRCPCMAHH